MRSIRAQNLLVTIFRLHVSLALKQQYKPSRREGLYCSFKAIPVHWVQIPIMAHSSLSLKLWGLLQTLKLRSLLVTCFKETPATLHPIQSHGHQPHSNLARRAPPVHRRWKVTQTSITSSPKIHLKNSSV